MPLQVLADRAGLSKSFLSLVENGHRQLDRRSHITAIADALDVSVGEITGQPYFPPPAPDGVGGHGAVPKVRLALLGSSLEEPADVAARPSTQLAEETSRVELLCEASDYGAFGRLLPDLIPQLHVAVADGDERDQKDALRYLIRAYHATFYLLKDLGYLDLAQIAVHDAREAAKMLDDPSMSGLAAFVRTHALLPAGVYTAALMSARRAAERLQPHMAERTVAELYGMLHLSAALASVNLTQPSDISTHLTEAQATSERIGEGNAFGLHFGPTNVGIWRVALLVELGEPDKAVEVTESVQPELISSHGRRATFYADWGRALAQLPGRERDAIEKLRIAERHAPEQIRNNPLVRETVTHLLERARSAAGGRDLRGLAYRMGVA